MSPENVMYLPEGSICKDCVYCMLRIIEPLDYREFGLNEEAKDDTLVQSLCLLSDVDLCDHIVKECSKFESGGNLLMGNRFLA